jgi:hypothetical protein
MMNPPNYRLLYLTEAGVTLGNASCFATAWISGTLMAMLTQHAEDQLARLDRVTPKDGDEMNLVYREQGWIEAIKYFAKRGEFTAAGEAEASKLIAASAEWVSGLDADELVVPPVPDEGDDPGDAPVVASGL